MSYAVKSLILTTVLWAVVSCGPAARFPSEPIPQKPPGWESLSPLQTLQEAGRIICDASTFEAVGWMESRLERDGNKRFRVRWAFGPDGEYRFERGPDTAIFDTKSVAGVKDGVWHSIYRGIRQQPRSGPHNRSSGDMIMVTGMMGGGRTYPTAAARLVGSGWLEHFIHEEHYEFVGGERVNGYECKKIIVSSVQRNSISIWIDCDLGVLRKWKSGDDSAVYDTIRLNPPLARREFKIPSEAIKERVPKAYGPHSLKVTVSIMQPNASRQPAN